MRSRSLGLEVCEQRRAVLRRHRHPEAVPRVFRRLPVVDELAAGRVVPEDRPSGRRQLGRRYVSVVARRTDELLRLYRLHRARARLLDRSRVDVELERYRGAALDGVIHDRRRRRHIDRLVEAG